LKDNKFHLGMRLRKLRVQNGVNATGILDERAVEERAREKARRWGRERR